jgi:hypothetical protein
VNGWPAPDPADQFWPYWLTDRNTWQGCNADNPEVLSMLSHIGFELRFFNERHWWPSEWLDEATP